MQSICIIKVYLNDLQCIVKIFSYFMVWCSVYYHRSIYIPSISAAANTDLCRPGKQPTYIYFVFSYFVKQYLYIREKLANFLSSQLFSLAVKYIAYSSKNILIVSNQYMRVLIKFNWVLAGSQSWIWCTNNNGFLWYPYLSQIHFSIETIPSPCDHGFPSFEVSSAAVFR